MNELIKIRRHLHRYPEISMNEFQTNRFLGQKLNELNPDELNTVAGTGILVGFRGKNPGKNLLVRGDIDALPIQEKNTFSHRSTIPGMSHKCGHDGHATILYGLAKQWSEMPPEYGDVYLLFQPGEENGAGAKAVQASKVLDHIRLNYTVALHNLPDFPLHEIVCKPGNFTSGVISILIDFQGYTAHAAEPWNGKNPASAISELILSSLRLSQESNADYVTVTPVYAHLGSKNYGISAGEGTVHLTVRANTSSQLKSTLSMIETSARHIAQKENLNVLFDYREAFEPIENDPKMVDIIRQSAALCGLHYTEKAHPFRWGEDYGLFTKMYPGAMFGIGAGEHCPPLHHPEYDFPDEITSTAICMFRAIQKKLQQTA